MKKCQCTISRDDAIERILVLWHDNRHAARKAVVQHAERLLTCLSSRGQNIRSSPSYGNLSRASADDPIMILMNRSRHRGLGLLMQTYHNEETQTQQAVSY